MAWKAVVVISMCLLGATSLISIVSSAIPFWSINKDVPAGSTNVTYMYRGLWKFCTKNSGPMYCSQIATQGWLKAVRAFVVMGIVATLVSLVMTALHLRTDKALFPATAAGASAIAWLFFIIAVAIYGSEMKFDNSGGHFGSGYYMAILCNIACLVSTVLILVSWRSSYRGGYNVVP